MRSSFKPTQPFSFSKHILFFKNKMKNCGSKAQLQMNFRSTALQVFCYYCYCLMCFVVFNHTTLFPTNCSKSGFGKFYANQTNRILDEYYCEFYSSLRESTNAFYIMLSELGIINTLF